MSVVLADGGSGGRGRWGTSIENENGEHKQSTQTPRQHRQTREAGTIQSHAGTGTTGTLISRTQKVIYWN